MNKTDWESVAYSMQDKVNQLQQQNRELVARVARLESGLSRIYVHCHEMQANEIEALAGCFIREDEKQSVAEIEDQAIGSYYAHIKELIEYPGDLPTPEDYAANLRKVRHD